MYLDVYIGDPEDPDFTWEPTNEQWSGNIPTRISPFVGGSREFSDLKRRIRAGELEGKQVDWGAWVTLLDKRGIQRLMSEWYGDAPLGPPPENPVDRVIWEGSRERRAFVDGLEEDRLYPVVASEL